jgi:hypothetical protein
LAPGNVVKMNNVCSAHYSHGFDHAGFAGIRSPGSKPMELDLTKVLDDTHGPGGLFARVPLAALVDRELNDGDLRTLTAICAYMGKDDYAWPSQTLIGIAAGRSRSAVNASVKRLAARGHLEVHRYRHRDGSRRCTYRVNFTPRRLPKLPRGHVAPTRLGLVAPVRHEPDQLEPDQL